jgi:hypothetical protein
MSGEADNYKKRFLGTMTYASPDGLTMESSDMWRNASAWGIREHSGMSVGSRLIRARIYVKGPPYEWWAWTSGILSTELEPMMDGLGMSLDHLGIEYGVLKRYIVTVGWEWYFFRKGQENE